MLLVNVLVVAVAVSLSSSMAQAACPSGFYDAGNHCIITIWQTMTLDDAEAHCVRLGGRIFAPSGATTTALKSYADATFLPNPDLWGRYWVGLTEDLSNAWQRNVVEQGELDSGPYCVALDYKRPLSQHLQFYGYDRVTCRDGVKLPTICRLNPIAIQPTPEPVLPADNIEATCPPPAPCPTCPAQVTCPPQVTCPSLTCPPTVTCKSESVTPRPPQSITAVNVCPSNWFARGQFCYHFRIAGQNWIEASLSCQKQNAHLVSILSKDENDYIGQISNDLSVATPTMRRFWIGLTDANQEGEMEWSNGDPISFTSWGPRQPSKHKIRRFRENCVITNNNMVGLWDDISCKKIHPYICKKTADTK
ncbi:uncharacterized protein [Asterias amurensis]|uniref:uncharacterized protein n=1 Tax=Asterias amurensis TaxID=7602 RepID=UPI003AB88C43